MGVMLKPVLGLFKNEDELRDHLADNLELIEPGLRLLKKNYPVDSPQGANGTLDILAKDKYGSFVIIEIKRSETAARQALHELSKYIAAFLATAHVDEQKIRCFVVSTLWHELDTPLAYFRQTAAVDVKGFQVTAPNGVIEVEERILPPVDCLPKLCPDTRFIQSTPGTPMSCIAEDLGRASARIPMVRAALLQFEPVAGHDDLAVLCIWRIADKEIESLASSLGPDYAKDRGGNYAGWAEESSVLDWLIEQSVHIKSEFGELRIGTPEKITTVLARRPFKELVRIGAWPAIDLVHDLEEMQRCVVAQDISSYGRRANRYLFNAKSSPRTGPTWNYLAAAFTSFVGFEKFWKSEVTRFLNSIQGAPDVIFYAEDCRHFQFRIHQHLHNSNAELSLFKITVVDATGANTHLLFGGWAWDGTTRPDNEIALLKATYGSIDWARRLLFSAVDNSRYESAYRAHGFHPFVLEYDMTTDPPSGQIIWCDPSPKNLDFQRGLQAFVKDNYDYCQRIAKVYEGIPAVPDGTRRPVLIEVTGN